MSATPAGSRLITISIIREHEATTGMLATGAKTKHVSSSRQGLIRTFRKKLIDKAIEYWTRYIDHYRNIADQRVREIVNVKAID
ncbi:MAG: hypothetical protein ACREP6_06255 [Candidatus Binataceae bacterium]